MPDPDLEIRSVCGGEGGGSHPDSYIVGGGGGSRSPKRFFSALRASVWCTNRGGGGNPGPFPGSATD